MNHISLFTGIGGIDLASEWAGFDTILQSMVSFKGGVIESGSEYTLLENPVNQRILLHHLR